MTVRELIEWLSSQDQDAIIEVIKHDRTGSQYEQGGTATTAEFTPELSTYTDFRGNAHVPADAPYANKRFLLLGESE